MQVRLRRPTVRVVHVLSCGAKPPFWQCQSRHPRSLLKAAQITDINEEEYQSKQVTAFPEEEISAIKHTVYVLFTKFTILFTILILQTERYQSNFGESNL
jgi:hypothetical protein